jgi:hypothetical protein
MVTLTAVPSSYYKLPAFIRHDDPTVAALLLAAYHRNEIGVDGECTLSPTASAANADEAQVDAAITDIADLLDKAEDYDADPSDAIDKHYGQPFSGPADAFADVERDKARADARLAAELLASLGGAR